MPIFQEAGATSSAPRGRFDANSFGFRAIGLLSQIGASPRQLATLVFIAFAPALALDTALALDLERPMDRGGRIGDYLNRMVAESGKRHVISGDCMSACTIWLGHKGTCVTPDAVLWFHSAGDPLQRMRNENPWQAMSPAGNRALLSMYPPRVRAVVAPWLETPDFHTLTGRELASLGVPLCSQRDLAGG